MKQPLFDFNPRTLTVADSPFLEARETSAMAAVSAQPFRGTQNTLIMQLITAAGEAGMSDPELERATGYSRQTICLRRHDLRGFLIPAVRRALSPSGRNCVCWRRANPEEQQRLREAWAK